ncbi:uncharacterized protein FYW49_014965 [Xenentodon cancila]
MSEPKRARDHDETLNSDDVYELSASDESEPEDNPSRAPFDPELDNSDDDGEGEACAPAAAHTAQSSFVLSGGSSAFSNRSHSIFDCLDSVERRTISSLKPDGITVNRKTRHPPSASPTPAKKRGVPDYLVHPERWTHYSLEDVPECSDKDNRTAAHQFLSGLQQERKSDSPCDIQQKMIFSRPQRPQKEQVAEQLSPDQQEREQGLHLSHLAEEDEDEERRGREKAGGRSEGVVKKTEEQGEDREKVMSATVWSAEKKKQTEAQEETKIEEFVPGFSSFKKTKRKNYRRSSEHEDD